MQLWMNPYADDRADYTMSGSAGLRLNHGDRVWLGHCEYPEYIYNGYMTHFSGVLMTPDL